MTRDNLKKMTYLSNVLKESSSTPSLLFHTELTVLLSALRLYPPVPVNTRVALRTTTLPTGGGTDGLSPVLVRRGEPVAYSVYSLHRQPHLYGKDSEDFRPERWGQDLPLFANETTANWGYLPFNGGPRVCLGREYFITSASYLHYYAFVLRSLETFESLTQYDGHNRRFRPY